MWQGYRSGEVWDEYMSADGTPRGEVIGLAGLLAEMGLADLRQRQGRAEQDIRDLGITFTLASLAEGGLDRSWPYDVVPRVIDLAQWDVISAGLSQRVEALNRFVADIYSGQEILADRVIPAELVLNSPNYRPECRYQMPPYGVWTHIAGLDLVRGAAGEWYVLEDNLRVPSGVSYMLENRLITKRVLSDLFRQCDVASVDAYIDHLKSLLLSLSPTDGGALALLTPGIHNSAYYEHAFLAQQLGIHLVEGQDLWVTPDDEVMLNTTRGPKRVDVIYRRVDDLWLDPEVFHEHSLVGTPGLMRAWRAGKVALVNAPGAGIADDKVLYSFVPELIRYYLEEDPILANVPTMWCGRTDERTHVLDRLDQLVVKPATESGGHGIHIGPQADERAIERTRERILADPGGFVAQPTLSLSTVPTLTEPGLAPRHVDLRPFILTGAQTHVTRGGLTRVARHEGSLVVNSSQGGGSKDTWVVDVRAAQTIRLS